MENELMPFDFETEQQTSPNYENKPIIKVIGVGGGGGNAVNTMYKEGIKNVEFIIANTDIQVLTKSPVPLKLQLGKTLTEGLGAGNDPETGKNAALESTDEISELLNDGTKMVFITAGMGGGTGTGAAPIIADIAKKMGILTIGIVTIPFRYEGQKRLDNAYAGLEEMRKSVDALIVIDNEKISIVYPTQNVLEAFKHADEVITIAAKGIAEIITKDGHINVDFADVKSVMKDSGVAVMGTGYGKGDNRGLEAVENAINSPLLNNNDIRGAEHLLVNIISPKEQPITVEETDKINSYLQEKAGNNANLIWGLTFDDTLANDQCAVTVIATNFNDNILPELTEPKKNNPQQKPSVDPLELAKERLKKEPTRNFDFLDPDTVNKYYEQPAYLRQNIMLQFSSNSNRFLNPRID